MNIYLRVDLEGVTGVVSYEQSEPGMPEYDLGRRMFVSDVNAAVAGCFDGGAERVVVYDMHYHGRNLPFDQMDARAELICGKPELSREFISRFDALIMVGFHAKAGAATLLAHSYEGGTSDLRINGTSVGEIGMEAAIAGECGVPLVLVTGDSAGCAEAKSLVPEVYTAVVKTSLSPQGALCLPVEKTRQLIRSSAAQAVRNARSIKPATIEPFDLLEVELVEPVPISRERLAAAGYAEVNGPMVSIRAESLHEAWHRYRRLRK